MNVYLWEKYKRPTGVKGWLWFMNDNLNDSSWNSHNASWTVTYTSWKFWKALNANSTYWTVSNTADLQIASGESFSIWFWIYQLEADTSSNLWCFLCKTNNIDTSKWWIFYRWSGSKKYTFRTNNWTLTSTAFDISWLQNAWHHLCVTYDWTTLKWYLDAVQQWSNTYTVGNCTESNNITIGYWWVNSLYPDYAKWYMDEVFFMKNYCLSQAEITAIQSWFYWWTDNPLNELKNAYIGEVVYQTYNLSAVDAGTGESITFNDISKSWYNVTSISVEWSWQVNSVSTGLLYTAITKTSDFNDARWFALNIGSGNTSAYSWLRVRQNWSNLTPWWNCQFSSSHINYTTNNTFKFTFDKDYNYNVVINWHTYSWTYTDATVKSAIDSILTSWTIKYRIWVSGTQISAETVIVTYEPA